MAVEQEDIFSGSDPLDEWLRRAGSDLAIPDNFTANLESGVVGYGSLSMPESSIMPNPITGTSNLSEVLSGSEIGSILAYGKRSFSDTSTEGWIQGLKTDGTYAWLMGGSSSSIDWNVTTASVLTIVGAITATTGTIGGFNIGSDYIRDAANSMGLASTVSGSDDVRFWAGDTYANRASAPFRVYESGAVVATSITLSGVVLANKGTFGGDGSDGALAVTSGTTTINLGGAAVVFKNYTSISITGTGGIVFSNPHANGTVVILKSQGGVTITSSATRAIDVRGIGGAGGAGGTGDGGNGTEGSYFASYLDTSVHGGGGGGTLGAGIGGAAGVVITAGTGPHYASTETNIRISNAIRVMPGSGGGGAESGRTGGSNGDGGAGGRGSGSLIIQCAGAYNATGTIDASGTVGVAGSLATTTGGGGGGGAGGMIVVIYNSLTADSGTYTVTGGAGGAAGATGIGGGGGGGGGGACLTVGTVGSDAVGAAGGSGGAGGTGSALRIQNNNFA